MRFPLPGAFLSLAFLLSPSLAQGGKDGHVVGSEQPPATPQPAEPVVGTPAPSSPLAHVEERGTGPIDLILIPGLSCDWRVFDSFLDRNTERYRMWAVTLPGFGGSDAPPLDKDAKLTDLAWLTNAERGVLKLIEDKKLAKPYIAGHSLGGHLAMRLATRHPEAVAGVIAIDSIPLYPPRVVAPDEVETPERRAITAQSQNEVMRIIPPENWKKQQVGGMRYLVKNPDRAKQLGEMCSVVPRDTTVQYMCEMMVSDLRPALKKTPARVLVLPALSLDGGVEAMNQARRVVAEQFEGMPPNIQVAYFEDTRHFIMDDRPAELDRAIAAFIAKQPVNDVLVTPPPGSTPK
jgi:pimeloyl-ACP methyl ester carboxylesterase